MKNLNQTISSLLKEETTTDNLAEIGSFLSEYNVTDIKNLNALLLEINKNIRIIQESPDTEDALNQLDQQLIDVISNFNEMLSASRTLSKLVTKTLTQFDKLS
jgi:hypothetical protein